MLPLGCFLSWNVNAVYMCSSCVLEGNHVMFVPITLTVVLDSIKNQVIWKKTCYLKKNYHITKRKKTTVIQGRKRRRSNPVFGRKRWRRKVNSTYIYPQQEWEAPGPDAWGLGAFICRFRWYLERAVGCRRAIDRRRRHCCNIVTAHTRIN